MTPLFDRLDALPALSPEERQLLDSVTALARDQIAPRAAGYDRTAEFPWDNIRAINALGLNAMFVPEAYGGAGLSYAAYLACVREISAACASTGIIWATNFHAAKPLIDFGTEEQKTRLLPRVAEGAIGALCITEPDSGSDATHMTTRFTPDGDEIVVSGGKTFISNGDVADLYLVFGKWAELGARPSDKNGRAAISAVYLEKGTPGLTVLRTEDKMGHRAASTAAIAFDGCRVPRANLLGMPGEGLKLLLSALNKSDRASPPMRSASPAPPSRMPSPMSTSGGNPGGASSSSKASSSCSPISPPSWRYAKRGCGMSRGSSMPARATSVQGSQLRHRC